jgi:nitric oxide reductase subunit C
MDEHPTEKASAPGSYAADSRFWRAGAIAATLFMSAVLAILTVDSLRAISTGGSHVPRYDVINRHIGYEFDADKDECVPKIGGEELLFGRRYDEKQASQLMTHGKFVIQSRACMDCHTFFGNGAYYAPDLTKAWLDPLWMSYPAQTRGEAMANFLMAPFHVGYHFMPNLHLDHGEAEAVVAYLKWMSAVDTNGFPDCAGRSPAK